MPFLAYHMSNSPSVGTVFVLMENGQISGQSKRDFPSMGEEIAIVGPNDIHQSAEVESASSVTVVIKDQNGVKFTLTPWRNGDMDPNFNSSMHFAYWTARSTE